VPVGGHARDYPTQIAACVRTSPVKLQENT
jgi:hypothetical protein